MTGAPSRSVGIPFKSWSYWRDAYRTALWDELTLGIPAPAVEELTRGRWTVRYNYDRKREVLERTPYVMLHGRVTGVTG